MGTPYEVSGLVTKQFVAATSSRSRAASRPAAACWRQLGIDFTSGCRTPRNEGAARSATRTTIKITGAADVKQVIADLEKITAGGVAQRAGRGRQGPAEADDRSRSGAPRDAIKALTVTVYTGADDKILRRLAVNADLKDTASKIDAALLLDVTFTKVGAGADVRRAAEPEAVR